MNNEKWEKEFDEKFGDNLSLDGPFDKSYAKLVLAPALKDFISQTIQAARIEVKVDRDDSWRAFLQKLAWKKEEIDDATEWVDRTPLRLRSNHSLESIINKHQ